VHCSGGRKTSVVVSSPRRDRGARSGPDPLYVEPYWRIPYDPQYVGDTAAMPLPQLLGRRWCRRLDMGGASPETSLSRCRGIRSEPPRTRYRAAWCCWKVGMIRIPQLCGSETARQKPSPCPEFVIWRTKSDQHQYTPPCCCSYYRSFWVPYNTSLMRPKNGASGCNPGFSAHPPGFAPLHQATPAPP
jgi:hypothetical protein